MTSGPVRIRYDITFDSNHARFNRISQIEKEIAGRSQQCTQNALRKMAKVELSFLRRTATIMAVLQAA